jgi:hypothetical protein
MHDIIAVIVFVIIIYKFFTWKEKPTNDPDEIRTRNLDKNYHD